MWGILDRRRRAPEGHVIRPRLTQTMNLLVLAPAVQEAIMFLRRVDNGPDRIF